MKTYFAKYLPVEGEIKDGDSIIIDNNLIYKYSSKWQKEFRRYNPKKVKLFLCSRDIKVGDKIWHDIDKSNTLNVLEKDPGENWNGGSWTFYAALDGEDFKVIGQISENATFINESDEFDEDEIHKCFVPDKGNPMIRKVQIKCPKCKTFH